MSSIKSSCGLGSLSGSVVKNPPANTGDGFDPLCRKIPYAAEQLSLSAATIEPASPRARALEQENPPQ